MRRGLIVRMLLAVAAPVTLAAQTVRYEVSVTSIAGKLFHSRVTFPAAGRDSLLVSLPAWSPGAYTITDHARFVRGFRASANGTPLTWERFDKDTWRVRTGGAATVTVEFDYFADTIDLALARIADDFGVFLGTNLFPYEEGRLDRAAEVRFTLPAGWDVMTALRPAAGGAYTAPDYHELADAMTFVGRFARDSLRVDGAWLRIGLWPAAAYTPAVARNLRGTIERQVRAQNRLLGGPPYEVYTVFINAVRDPIQYGGGLEHSYSHYDIMPATAFATAEGELGPFMPALLSHEFFHLWNVKRIRPAELWPYDYHAEQYTPLLWWAEGVTDYYADVTNRRAGVWTDGELVGSITSNIGQVESAPEPWSVEDGSLATWIDEVYVNSSQLYYPKGSLIGLLLDISIRDATDNAKSLDDVVRALYTRFAQRRRGFTTQDLLGLLREVGMPDVDGFYRRYVDGREPLPYETVLPKAGLAVDKETVTTPFLGLGWGNAPDGKVLVAEVTPGSSADEAGLRPGDEVLEIGGMAARGDGSWGPAFRSRFRGRAGEPLSIVVQRDGQRLTLTARVQERTSHRYTVSRAAAPTPQQARIWAGITGG